MEEELKQENDVKELSLRVFQYTDYDYVIGLVDFDQLNSSDFAFNINHALFVIYDDEIDNYRLYEDVIVDSSMIYNLNKNKVITIFSPSESLEAEYYELAHRISERDNFELDDENDNDEQKLDNFYLIGQIQ